MKHAIIAKAFTITAVTALALGIAPMAKAQANLGCSNASLHGTFAYTSTGTILSPSAFAGPIAEVGTQYFDGSGNTTGAATLSGNGTIYQLTIAGTYIVTSNCTGSFTLMVTYPVSSGVGTIPVFVFFAIDNNGTEFQAIETTSGDVITRLGRKIFPGTDI